MYDVIYMVVEVMSSEFATCSWMGWDEAIIAKWETRTGSGYLAIAIKVIVGYSFFIEISF